MIARLFAAANDPRAGILARTVLFVEDEDLVRDFVARELEDAGFVVFEAGTAEEGMEILEREPVGSLFTDIRLPGPMDGWRLAEAAREIHPKLPVLYATGFTAEAPRLVPGSVFLRKPYLPSAVIAALGRLIENAQD
jgi:DNA-binding response OmpR family regulator